MLDIDFGKPTNGSGIALEWDDLILTQYTPNNAIYIEFKVPLGATVDVTVRGNTQRMTLAGDKALLFFYTTGKDEFISLQGSFSETPVIGKLDGGVIDFEIKVTSNGKNTVKSGSFRTSVFIPPEPDNNSPTVTLNTPQSQTLFENDNLSIDGTAQDADKGDVVVVKAKIADSRTINLSTKVSDGKPFDFANTFLFKQGRLWQGNDPITSVLDGAGYKIEVWAEDDKGGKSKVETRSFSVVANRPPIVKVTKTPSFTNITNSTRLEVAGTITDPDGHDVTMTAKLNDAPQEEIAVNQGEWNYIFEAASLKEGANELTIVGRDEYGMSHTKTVRINNTIYKADMSHVPSVALFDIPLEGVESDGAVMWLRRKSDNTQFEARVATAGKKEEDFHEMQKTSHVVGNTPRDQFAGQTGAKTNNVTVEITSTGNHSLLMIQGVVK